MSESGEEVCQAVSEAREEEGSQSESETSWIVSESRVDEGMDLYHIIAPYVLRHIGEGMTKEEAAEVFHVAKGQMNIWLKQLCQDSRLKCVQGRYVKL